MFSGSPIEQFNANLITCQVFRDNLSNLSVLGMLACCEQW